MLNNLFDSIWNSSEAAASTATATINFPQLMICTLVSLILGLLAAFIYMFRNTYNKNFVVTLALLPAIVQMIIMMVNGSVGTGVAVMGAFSLIRFRSVPGSSRDICSIFLAMALGLATGMGYIALAFVFLIIIGGASLLFIVSPLGKTNGSAKDLKITIPENIDYDGIFDDIFDEFTSKATLENVKVTNMGSLFELKYHITLKDPQNEKKMIDGIRCRNGNLNISCGRATAGREEL